MQRNLITVPLSCFVDSNANARTGELPNIPAPAATIRAHGLMYSLIITEIKKGRKTCYPVAAGRRRRAALELLRDQGAIGADHEALCLLVESEAETLELSTAENTEREDMHPADEYEASCGMMDAGTSIEDVAARYGATPAVVERRLKLVKASPALIAAYCVDDMPLEQLMTMTVAGDHTAQEQVQKFQPHHERTPEKLRRTLFGQNTVRSDSPPAAYVSKDAYLAAGGRMQADSFQSAAYWLDGALMRDVTLGKTGAEAEVIRTAEGWAWALALLNPSYSDMDTLGHALTTLCESTKKEAAAIRKLGIHKAKIERDMGSMEERDEEESEVYVTLSDEWDKVRSELSDLGDQMQVVVDKGLVGVVALLQHNTVKILCGAIKSEGRKAVVKIERAVTRVVSGDGDSTDVAPASTLSEKLIRILTAQHITALQAVLIGRTDVVLATLTYELVSPLWSERCWRAGAVGVRTTDMRYTVTQADANIETPRA